MKKVSLVLAVVIAAGIGAWLLRRWFPEWIRLAGRLRKTIPVSDGAVPGRP
jgi:hypothetical protein